MQRFVKSDRHQSAIEYAIDQIKKSDIFPYVSQIILFGSCARTEEKWDSDIDLLLVLDNEFHKYPELKKALRILQCDVTCPEISAPETDLKITIGQDWKKDNSQFYNNIRKDGIHLWE